MNKTRYDFVILIGRCQPPHTAHISIIEQAYQHTDNVIVLLGSANQPRTIKNPWTWGERQQMIQAATTIPLSGTLTCLPTRDFMYNDQLWIGHLQQVVAQHISVVTGDTTASVALIGHTKDETSYYLSMFPQWDPIEFTGIDDLHATDIRAHLFTQNISEFDKFVGHSLPVPIHDYLKAFTHTAHFDQLREEYAFIEQYKRSWLSAPYAPIFFTGDAVVIQSGHVLLVRRRSEPGKNLWAIPGGFLNYNERIDDVAIRELIEETKINCPAKVLYGSIAARHTFDHPDRSLRGRTITYASLIELPPGKLHKVKGGDDAEKARWVPLSTFQQMEDQMFEDHFQIINVFLGEV